VVDSSVAIAWVVRSQSSDAADQLLGEVQSGELFLVPVLWMFEVANALVSLRRRRRVEEHQYQQARIDLNDLRPAVDDEGSRLAFDKTSELAQRYDLSVYDAVYLELAIRRAVPLASRDATLNKAAKRAGVRTLL